MNNKKNLDYTYQVVQYFFLSLSIFVSIAVCIISDYKKLWFLPHLNVISIVAALILLCLMVKDKLNLLDDITDLAKENHKKHINVLVFILIVFIIPLIIFLFTCGYIMINSRYNDIIGILSLGIALSSDALSTSFINIKVKKSRKEYKQNF
ncbi:hypothetical protein [Bacillus toyonensis]|uniref:hypothetical protein n=1 Tax=Bacillus toyonensis TaxID=155322 RepID=UPI000BFDFC19|nr:hypothetical protein [Bacillus toyonensis]PHD33039.1 hypothetical protein COF48_19125 [Bacillus toyonensis]